MSKFILRSNKLLSCVFFLFFFVFRLSKRGTLVVETLSNYPSIESIISLLGYLTGVAQLLLQVIYSTSHFAHYTFIVCLSLGHKSLMKEHNAIQGVVRQNSQMLLFIVVIFVCFVIVLYLYLSCYQTFCCLYCRH